MARDAGSPSAFWQWKGIEELPMKKTIWSLLTLTAPIASAAAPKAEEAPAPKAKGKETGPIKVGILHSLSGTMAISETSLKDVALMTIEGINKAGGVLGRQLEPV